MELYLFRHGDSEPVRPGGTDEERQLSERGREEVQAVARALSRAGVQPQALVSSPLIRARQTGEIISQALRLPVEADEALRPGCGLSEVEAVVARGSLDRVLLVGHEPDLSAMIGQLIGGGRVRLQTSAVARLELSAVGPGQGALVWLLTPALARAWG